MALPLDAQLNAPWVEDAVRDWVPTAPGGFAAPSSGGVALPHVVPVSTETHSADGTDRDGRGDGSDGLKGSKRTLGAPGACGTVGRSSAGLDGAPQVLCARQECSPRSGISRACLRLSHPSLPLHILQMALQEVVGNVREVGNGSPRRDLLEVIGGHAGRIPDDGTIAIGAIGAANVVSVEGKHSACPQLDMLSGVPGIPEALDKTGHGKGPVVVGEKFIYDGV